MTELIVEIHTGSDRKVGRFKNARLEMLPDHHYVITGIFYEPDGTVAERIEFNPQVLPYIADISHASKCGHNKLVDVYVQRGRQPIAMTGVCEATKVIS